MLLTFPNPLNAQNSSGGHLNWYSPTQPIPTEEKRAFIYGEMEVLASGPEIYFCGIQWDNSPATGYCGIQEYANHTRHTIYSVWDTGPKLPSAFVEGDAQTHHAHPHGTVEDAEGTRVDYNWQVGKVFQFALRKEPNKSGRNALTTFYFFDEQRKKWVSQATVASAVSDKGFGSTFGILVCSFLENWSGAHREIPKLCLYRLWAGTSLDDLKFVRKASGDGHWGILNDSYYLAEGNDAALDALIAKNSNAKNNMIRVKDKKKVLTIPDRALAPETVKALKALPIPAAAAEDKPPPQAKTEKLDGVRWRPCAFNGRIWGTALDTERFRVEKDAGGCWKLANLSEANARAVMGPVDIRDGAIEFELKPSAVCEVGIGSSTGSDANRYFHPTQDQLNVWNKVRLELKNGEYKITVNDLNVPVGVYGDAKDMFAPYISVPAGNALELKNVRQEKSQRLP